MNVLDAAHAMVHDYKGGADSLAPRIGVSSGQMLRNKVNDKQETHHLTLRESALIVSVTGDKRVPAAFASLVGCVLVEAGDFSGVSDLALLDAYAKMMSELGDFSREFNTALQDGKITQKEIKRLEQQMHEFQTAGAELVNRARAIAEPEQGKKK